VLGFELKASTLKLHQPFFVIGYFEMGSLEYLPKAGFDTTNLCLLNS
jgi:hypothetical protein